ncbi:MAG TPA: hypothetical protein DDY81_03100, partial [Clostridiales bacterium]|nr:hypothetical protein [Clostridiales bacterium]
MLERYPNIQSRYTTLTAYLYYYDDTGAKLLYTETITNGGDGKYTGRPSKNPTAATTFTFSGWSGKPGGSKDADCRKNVLTDRGVYAVYDEAVRKYT